MTAFSKFKKESSGTHSSPRSNSWSRASGITSGCRARVGGMAVASGGGGSRERRPAAHLLLATGTPRLSAHF